MKLRKSLACLLILAFVFANLPTGMAMVSAENTGSTGSTGSSAGVFARAVTTQSDDEFTSPVYFFKQGYTEKVNSSTATNFSVTDGRLVATRSVYAYVKFNSGAADWSVASDGQLKFDIKAVWGGTIKFRIIQEQYKDSNYVEIEIPVTAEMTEQTIDLSSVSGLDLSNVWGFGVVSYCGEVSFDNVRLEWTTGGTTEAEPITGNKTFYYFKDDFNGIVDNADKNTVVSGAWEVSNTYVNNLLQTTTVPEITADDVENATLKFKLKVSAGIGGEIHVYLGNAVDAGGWDKRYVSKYVISFDNSNTDWQELSVSLKDFPTTAAYDIWNASPEDTRELDITKLDVFGINCKTWGGDGKVYVDEVCLEWTTGGITEEEPIEDNKTFYYFEDDFNGTVSDTTYNTVVSGTWEVSGFYTIYQMKTTTAPEITAADVENATLKFKLKVSSGIRGEIRVYLGNAVDAEGSVKNYLSEYSITFDKSNTDWQEISVPLKDFPTTAAYSNWKQYADDTRELDITKLDVFGITCRTYGGDGKVYFDDVRLE